MSTSDEPEGLDNVYDDIKGVADITPVDELFSNVAYYLQNFKLSSQGSVKECLARVPLAWEEAQGAIDHMEQLDGSSPIQPVHDHLRGMLLPRRSSSQNRDYTPDF